MVKKRPHQIEASDITGLKYLDRVFRCLNACVPRVQNATKPVIGNCSTISIARCSCFISSTRLLLHYVDYSRPVNSKKFRENSTVHDLL